MKTKDLSFIIVNYNSEKYLKVCIGAILDKAKSLNFEVIIVNNDKRRINFADFADSRCVIEEVNENVGFGAACNKGSELASGEVLCFINPDTELISKNAVDVIDKLRNSQYLGIIGPRVIESKGIVQPWSAGFKLTLPELLMNNLGIIRSKHVWESGLEREVDWVTGASMFIKKDLFETLGGFDERFFMYFEDMDLCMRAKQLGKKALYFPTVEVMHQGGGSVTHEASQKEQYYQSQEYYFQKHFSIPHKYLVKALRILCK
ncbi:glycosyltransferase family 2 protein [Patescibacteria group bacterium]